jgi:hypothetical protein
MSKCTGFHDGYSENQCADLCSTVHIFVFLPIKVFVFLKFNQLHEMWSGLYYMSLICNLPLQKTTLLNMKQTGVTYLYTKISKHLTGYNKLNF